MKYHDDPRWVKTHIGGICYQPGCGKWLSPGRHVYWYPRSRGVLCEEHGRAAERDFLAHAFDEEVYHAV